MIDPLREARHGVSQALCAAVIARPLDPGLSEEEMREALVLVGLGPGAVEEAIAEAWSDLAKDAEGRAVAEMRTWDRFLSGMNPVAEELVPRRALTKLKSAMFTLDQQHGAGAPKSLAMIAAVTSGVREAELKQALGMMLSFKRLQRVGDGFVTTRLPWVDYDRSPPSPRPHPWEQAIHALVPKVTAIVARRQGVAVPEMRPIDQFAIFLKANGWNEFATWWSMTATELDGLRDAHHPTSICVLCGAMLEAALVAVSEPARSAGQWTQKFIKNDPKGWKLYDLLNQAEAAKTFTKDQASDGRQLADFRNRIHAGRFSAAGGPPFSPPHTNVHEAIRSRHTLDVLLDALMVWTAKLGTMGPQP